VAGMVCCPIVFLELKVLLAPVSSSLQDHPIYLSDMMKILKKTSRPNILYSAPSGNWSHFYPYHFPNGPLTKSIIISLRMAQVPHVWKRLVGGWAWASRNALLLLSSEERHEMTHLGYFELFLHNATAE